jgi:hypothetical protein
VKIEAIAFIWDGRTMVPLDRYRALADRQFRAGQEYALVPHQARSDKSHSHYFACLKKTWENLPEKEAKFFLTAEHLRKWCLVKEGYADENTHVCQTEAAAMELAALIRTLDGYAVMQISGTILTIWTAKSQDHHHMNHEEFQTSKTKVLERCAAMIGATLKELTDYSKEDA